MKGFYMVSFSVLITLGNAKTFAQAVNTLGQLEGFIPTAVPFLLIAPDARSNAMGCTGAATTPGLNSLHWNPSKLVFVNGNFGISASHLPWLRQLVNDINYSNISAFVKIDSLSKIGGSFKYFSLGLIDYTTSTGMSMGAKSPVEYSVDFTYSRRLSKRTSGGISFRYIYSEALSANVFNYPFPETIKTFSFDASIFHFIPITILSKQAQVSLGTAFTNIGPLNKGNDSTRFLPANLRTGTSLKLLFSENHSLEISFDANKLLAPDNPGNYCYPNKGFCTLGTVQPKNWSEGVFGSFTDAAGGFEEELREINLSIGAEYWFKQLIAFRSGYFYEHPQKGSRQFFTIGSGVKYKSICFDLAYLICTGQRNPLENTLSFSLSFYFTKSNYIGLKNIHHNNS
jgi:type IX secretion system protein PorV